MDRKGQGALEYLLLIGGAVLVAAIVIALITGIPTGTTNPTETVICAENNTAASCLSETDASCTLRGLDGEEYATEAAMTNAGTTFAACVPA